MKGLVRKFLVGGFIGLILITWIFQVSIIDNPSLNNPKYAFEVSKNVFTGVISVIGISIAYEGLTTWKDQLSGTHDFDLANRLLIALGKLDHAYTNFSTMWIFLFEIGNEKIPYIRLSISDLYWENLNNLRTASSEFHSLSTEVELTWQDFDKSQLTNLIILSKTYLRKAEVFLHYLSQFQNNDKFQHGFRINMKSIEDTKTKSFVELCSHIILNVDENKGIHPTEFQQKNLEWRQAYFLLSKSIQDRIQANTV